MNVNEKEVDKKSNNSYNNTYKYEHLLHEIMENIFGNIRDILFILDSTLFRSKVCTTFYRARFYIVEYHNTLFDVIRFTLLNAIVAWNKFEYE